ncbi:MAG: RtcB family protein [Kribbellaceae bacterium]
MASRSASLPVGSRKRCMPVGCAAYKDSQEVVATSERARLAREVARLVPIGVVKG